MWLPLDLKLGEIGGQRRKIHQCQFGLRGPQGGLHLKPTGFWSDNPAFVAELDKGNYTCKGGHDHEQVQTANAAATAHYPPQLA